MTSFSTSLRTIIKITLTSSTVCILLPLLFCLSIAIEPARCRASERQAQAEHGPDLRIDFLGAEKGFAGGSRTVTMLCVIRNAGSVALPENTTRVRCYPLMGLDFMDGQLWPYLPALAPDQSVAFRWRVAITDFTSPLLFSALITRGDRAQPEGEGRAAGGPRVPSAAEPAFVPKVNAVLIPHFPDVPHLLGSTGVQAKGPSAAAGRAFAVVGNDRTRIQMLRAQNRVPLLALAAKENADWKLLSLAFPVFQVTSGEEGQIPWSETFRWTDTQIVNSPKSAFMTLFGTIGQRWNAELTFETRADTGVIYGRARLTARRNMRLYGVMLPRLQAASPAPSAGRPRADGSAELLPPDTSPVAAEPLVSADNTGSVTYGIAWPSTCAITDWHPKRLPVGDVDHLRILGADWSGDDRGELCQAGGAVEFSFKIFAIAQSYTVRDALRYAQP